MNNLVYSTNYNNKRGITSIMKWMGLLLIFSIVVVSLSLGSLSASANTSEEVIAYVRADTGDEIRLIDPEGVNDRLLWTHGHPDPEDVYQVWDLAWRPGGGVLAFNSDHENYCSILHSDLYAVGIDEADTGESPRVRHATN